MRWYCRWQRFAFDHAQARPGLRAGRQHAGLPARLMQTPRYFDDIMRLSTHCQPPPSDPGEHAGLRQPALQRVRTSLERTRALRQSRICLDPEMR